MQHALIEGVAFKSESQEAFPCQVKPIIRGMGIGTVN